MQKLLILLSSAWINRFFFYRKPMCAHKTTTTKSRKTKVTYKNQEIANSVLVKKKSYTTIYYSSFNWVSGLFRRSNWKYFTFRKKNARNLLIFLRVRTQSTRWIIFELFGKVCKIQNKNDEQSIIIRMHNRLLILKEIPTPFEFLWKKKTEDFCFKCRYISIFRRLFETKIY